MRKFYCPKGHRLTDEEARELIAALGPLWTSCEHCFQWYIGARKFKAKRTGES